MSFLWYRWAKNQKDLSPPEKAVLVSIADYYNDEKGCAWPSQDTLAVDTSYSRATINRACKSLKQKGYISWHKDIQSNGQFPNNTYKLHRVTERRVAENDEADSQTTMSHSDTSPCDMKLHKPSDKPLELTLNNNQGSKEELGLSPAQKQLAETWTSKLINRGQYDSYEDIKKDCERFILSPQTDEDWRELGNGLPNPKHSS